MCILDDKAMCRAIIAGLLSGLRTTFGLAATSWKLSKAGDKNIKDSKIAFMASPNTAKSFSAMALVEITMDKMPFTPDRIQPTGLICRGSAGALCGAALYEADGKNSLSGALMGAAAAIAGSFAGFYLRKAIVKGTKAHDPIIGAAEDAVAIYAALKLITSE